MRAGRPHGSRPASWSRSPARCPTARASSSSTSRRRSSTATRSSGSSADARAAGGRASPSCSSRTTCRRSTRSARRSPCCATPRHIVTAPVAELPKDTPDRGDDRRERESAGVADAAGPAPPPMRAGGLEVDGISRRATSPTSALPCGAARSSAFPAPPVERPDRRRRGGGRPRPAPRPGRSGSTAGGLPSGDVPGGAGARRRLRAEEPAPRRASSCRNRSPTTPP